VAQIDARADRSVPIGVPEIPAVRDQGMRRFELVMGD
jgi:hypothetical protein